MEVKIENKQIQKIKIQKVYILRHQKKKKKIPHMNNIEKGRINKKKNLSNELQICNNKGCGFNSMIN